MKKRLFFSIIAMALCLPAWCQLRGDINCDGRVDVDDVNSVIGIILGRDQLGNEGDQHTYTVGNVSFTMVTVAGGTFVMGATDDNSEASSDERPAHRVNLAAYTICTTEVTQALWKAVMGSNPSSFTGNLQRPVENVTWNECQTFIKKLNQMTGKTFRLPTEAEWEYAARGGINNHGFTFAGSNNIDDVAWYSNNSGSTTAPVATKSPNELGLYDMSGNVSEWCSDWYGSYDSEVQYNPQGPTTGNYRVNRGGNWMLGSGYCRTLRRDWRGPDAKSTIIGLRLAM
jgi:formylglycine-generating enzyme required for sulfatase activity